MGQLIFIVNSGTTGGANLQSSYDAGPNGLIVTDATGPFGVDFIRLENEQVSTINGTTGAGHGLELKAGDAGTTTPLAPLGGQLTLNAGSGGDVAGGANTAGDGGAVLVVAGRAGQGSGGAAPATGGPLNISAGLGGAGTGGFVSITSGSGTIASGNTDITVGTSPGTVGTASITGGTAAGNADGGPVTIRGGAGSGTGDGGDTTVGGGIGGATNGLGGDLILLSGAQNGGGNDTAGSIQAALNNTPGNAAATNGGFYIDPVLGRMTIRNYVPVATETGTLQLNVVDEAGENAQSNWGPGILHYRSEQGAGSDVRVGFRGSKTPGLIGLMARIFSLPFTSADMVGDVLTVTHNLETDAPLVQVYDDAGVLQNPAGASFNATILSIARSNTNTTTITFTPVTVAGNPWQVTVVGI